MRRFLVCIVCATALKAQSVSITSPAPNQVLSGFTGFSFTVALSSAPSVSGVCYTVDAYPALNPGFGALMTVGCSITTPFSMPWNSFWVGNGSHQVIATAYNSLGGTVATSPAVAFTVANSAPVSYIPGCTVTPATPFSSNWSGRVSVQMTLTGSGSGNSKTFTWYLDGIPQQTDLNVASAIKAALIDTTQVQNGTHVVAGIVIDNAGGTTYSDNDYEGLACEFSNTIAVANGAVVSEVRNAARDIYLAPGGTFSLAPSVINTDGTTVSPPNFDYLMLPSLTGSTVATVNSSGLITASAVSSGNAQSAQVLTMAETATGCTDLVMSGSMTRTIWSTSCYVFNNSDLNKLIRIIGGNGWTPGIYHITAVNPDTNPPQAILNNQPAALGSTGGSFALGPTRTSWVFVWTDNVMPHLGKDFAIHTTYGPNSLWLHEMFNSGDIPSDQQYISPANPFAATGFVGDMNASAFNAIEFGCVYSVLDGFASGQMSAFQNGQMNYRLGITAAVAGYNKYLWCTGDNFVRQPSNLYATVAGPASAWATPGLQFVLADFKNSSIPFLGASMMDEFSYSSHPLGGPITFGISSQSWLSSIVSNGTTCTVNGTGIDVGLNYFTVTGSVTTGMNGLNYHANSVTSTSFTFPCSVAAGTYNASNDPALAINPLTASYSTGGNVIPYNAFAAVMTQANAVSGRAFMSWPPGAGTNCTQTANVLGNGTQSLGAITQISDYADLYTSHVNENYLPSREQSNSVTGLQNSLSVGYWIRARYGCFSPDKPVIVISQGTPHQRGWQGYPVTVSSFTGSTITTTTPHGILNILPGNTRLWLTGMSNSADNGNYYIISAPTATTLTVALASTSFTCTGACASGTTGTLTFQNGDQLTLTSMTAAGTTDGVGGQTGFQYSGSANNNVNRHRGQTFSVSVGGTQAASYNANTFLYTAENLNLATDTMGSPQNYFNFYRQIPVGSSTGGTATILPDNRFVAGMSARQILQNYTTPGLAFGTMIECAIVRCVGERLYKTDASENGYNYSPIGSPGAGVFFVGGGYKGLNLSANLWRKFADNQASGQVFANPHFEDGLAVPIFHANNMAALMETRWQKFLFTPALNAPDLGPLISCGARAQLLFCWNASGGPQTRTFTLTPYLQSGQQIAQYIANWQGITMSTIAAGTNTISVTLQPDDSVWFAFPTNFTAEIAQPVISARLADIATAAKVVIRYAYDLYWLDAPANTAFDCGAGTCVPAWDRNIGPVYYRLIYLDSSSRVLATSDVSTL